LFPSEGWGVEQAAGDVEMRFGVAKIIEPAVGGEEPDGQGAG